MVLILCQNGEIDICSDRGRSDLEFADHFVLLGENPRKLDCLNQIVSTFEFCFTPPDYKMLLHYWIWLQTEPCSCIEGSG